MADRANGRAPYFADPLRNVIGHCENLVPVVVEEQMEITKVGPAHMPVKVFGLEIKREDVSEERIERCGNVLYRFWGDVGRGVEWSLLQGYEILRFIHPRFLKAQVK